MELNYQAPSQTQGQVSQSSAMAKKDYWLGLLVGFLIGLMLMPVLKTAKPDIYVKVQLAILPFFVLATPLGLIACHAIGRKIAVIWQFGKFFVTGVMNVLVDFGVLTIATAAFRNSLNINSTDVFFTVGFAVTFYSLYKAMSFTVANINSYFWNKYWTFSKVGDKKSEFFQFFTVSLIGFVINVAVASFIFNGFSHIDKMNLDQWGLIGAAAGSIAGLMWNFLGYKFLVFKE